MTKFLNISTDTTLGGNAPSDEILSSQKALKTYIDNNGAGTVSWGNITGTMSNQTDLQNALDSCVHLAGTETITGLKTFKQAYSRISYMINSMINLTSTPSSNVHAFIDFVDAQTTPARIGVMGARQTTDGWYGTYMQAGNVGSVGISTDGTNIRTDAPTPSNANDNSRQIATTAWVNNHEDTQKTNCIVQIPQDINLTLSNGTLTLKSGSKAYVPNGVGVFAIATNTADLTRSTFGSGSGAYYIMAVYNGTNLSSLSFQNVSTAGSGTTPPTNGNYYNLTDNKIYNYSSGSISDQRAFPLGIMTLAAGVPTSIDQVFNGFGYMGSTMFALPGVKGLIPNGRNTDGTLKNTLAETTAVQVYNVSSPQNNYVYQLTYNGSLAPFYTHISYNETDNVNLYTTGIRAAWGIIGHCSFSSGRISNFVVKQPFHAVDYSDYIKASGTVVAEQLPTSANNYTWFRKYANGWVEQGGTYSWSGNGEKGPVSLPIAMSNTNYQVMMTTVGTDVDGSDTTTIYSRTTSSFNIGAYASSRELVWEVKGMAA